METLIALVMALVGGLIMSRVVKLVNLPNVTGYLVAGLILGPYCLKMILPEAAAGLSTVTTVALGFIAFSIGGEFKIADLKKLGSSVLTITFLQAAGAVGLVMIGLAVMGIFMPDRINAPLILLLGAISAATAPAATLMVVRQYKAKGPVTDTLLPVVAFDDAIGLMIFSVCISLARVFASGAELTLTSTLWEPLLEIVLSLAVGGAAGFLLGLSPRLFRSRANRLCLMILAVVGCVVLSQLWNLSSLLTCMMVGAVFANMRDDAHTILDGCERWTPPLFMLFFVISGAELDLKVLPLVGLVGVGYILFRSLGKYFGAYAGAAIVKADPHVKKYLGVALLPQAGVAIGMAQMVAADTMLGDVSQQVVTVVLAATLFYELVGPVLTKIVLTRAGEIVPEKKDKEQKAA